MPSITTSWRFPFCRLNAASSEAGSLCSNFSERHRDKSRAITQTEMGAIIQDRDVAFCATDPEIVPSAPPNPLLKSIASSRPRNSATSPFEFAMKIGHPGKHGRTARPHSVGRSAS